MRGAIAAATLGAGALFVGALALFASFVGGVRWQAFERAPERLGRVPAIVEPDAPTVLTMTASDVDSVPRALEARPRPAAVAAEPAVGLGDVEPERPRAKAAARKGPARRPTLFKRVGLGGGRPGLQLGAAPNFDGGGSGAFSDGGGGAAEDGEAPAPARTGPAPAPARQRTLRAVTPARGSVAPAAAPATAAPPAEEPAAEDGDGGE